MRADQVLTGIDSRKLQIASEHQEPTRIGDTLSSVLATIVVTRDPPDLAGRLGRASKPQHHGKRNAARKFRNVRSGEKSKGGWPSSPHLAWADVKAIDDVVHEMARRGCAPTHLVTIMPSAANDSSRKKECTRKIAHLGQALKRHGKPHMGVTVFERPTHADLHAHHLIHTPRGEFSTVERFHWPPRVHVQRVRKLDGIVDYLTKERRHLSPDFEARIKRRWARGQQVPGKRWTMTTQARELIAMERDGTRHDQKH